jgi:hypothetical protein
LITNTACGRPANLSREPMESICLAALTPSAAISASTLIEHPERGLLVNEVNHTMEFHTTQPICDRHRRPDRAVRPGRFARQGRDPCRHRSVIGAGASSCDCCCSIRRSKWRP